MAVNMKDEFPYYQSVLRVAEQSCFCGYVSRFLACSDYIWSLQRAVGNHRGRHTDGDVDCGICATSMVRISQYENEKIELLTKCVHMRDAMNYFVRTANFENK